MHEPVGRSAPWLLRIESHRRHRQNKAKTISEHYWFEFLHQGHAFMSFLKSKTAVGLLIKLMLHWLMTPQYAVSFRGDSRIRRKGGAEAWVGSGACSPGGFFVERHISRMLVASRVFFAAWKSRCLPKILVMSESQSENNCIHVEDNNCKCSIPCEITYMYVLYTCSRAIMPAWMLIPGFLSRWHNSMVIFKAQRNGAVTAWLL